MRAPSADGLNGANKSNGQMVSMSNDIPTNRPESVQADSSWFSDVCRQLVRKDAGLALHLLTGFEERTCYRYAANDRKPPGYFIRALLRSAQGEMWLAALMDGSDATWWKELQKARRIAEVMRD